MTSLWGEAAMNSRRRVSGTDTHNAVMPTQVGIHSCCAKRGGYLTGNVREGLLMRPANAADGAQVEAWIDPGLRPYALT